MTVPKEQLSSIPALVDVTRLMEMVSVVGHLATLKMSQSFCPSLKMLCCGIRNICGVNQAIQDGSRIIKLLRSSLFMVFMTALSFFVIDGLLWCNQKVMNFSMSMTH